MDTHEQNPADDMRTLAKIAIAAIAVAIILAAHANPSRADVKLGPPVESDMTVRIGTFFPYDDTAREFGGMAPPAFGFEFRPDFIRRIDSSGYSAYFDYVRESSQPGVVQGAAIGISWRSRGSLSFGVGAASATTFTTLFDAGSSASGATTRLGGKVFFAKRFRNGTSIEVTDYIFPAALGINPSGFGISTSTSF